MTLSGTRTLCGWKALAWLGFVTDPEIPGVADSQTVPCCSENYVLPVLCTFYITTKLSSDGIPDACFNFDRCRHVNAKFGYLKSSYLRLSACATGLTCYSLSSVDPTIIL